MKRSLPLPQFVGFAFTSFFGTLLHFLYDWTGQSLPAALISGVNESTWEHMKLLFFPMFVFALLQYRLTETPPAFWCVKLCSIAAGLVLIPVLFYTLNGSFGTTPDWINIAIFFVSAAGAYLLEDLLLRTDALPCRRPWLAFALICLIGAAFVLFTFFPPQLPLFADPITGGYGIL